jgi:CheY-like chemotaxis protein
MSDKKRILIVEDNMDFAKIVKILMESLGYEVLIAVDTYLGTERVLKSDPDLVILDLEMPAGGGFVLLERIRQFPDKSSLPVVILTAKRLTEEERDKLKSLGVSAIYSKPYENSEFASTITSLVS